MLVCANGFMARGDAGGGGHNPSGKIQAFSWAPAPVGTTNINHMKLLQGNTDPVKLANLSKTLPAGKVFLRIDSQSTSKVADLLTRAADRPVASDGTITSHESLWPENGIATVRSRFASFFNAYKAAGGVVDYIILDFEGDYERFVMPPLWMRALDNDPRSADLKARLGWSTLVKDVYTPAERMMWRATVKSIVNDALNRAVMEPARAVYPNVGGSNFSAYIMTTANAGTALNARLEPDPQYFESNVGGTNTPSYYGSLTEEYATLVLAGNTPYGESPFAVLRHTLNHARAVFRSSDGTFMPWIPYNHYPGADLRPNAFRNNPYYAELIYQLALTGTDNFLYFNTRSLTGEYACTDEQDIQVDTALTTLNSKIGTVTRQCVTPEAMPWDSGLIATGTSVGNKVVWRVSVPPGVEQVKAYPTGEIINLNGEAGFWYESPGGQATRFERVEIIAPNVSFIAPKNGTGSRTFPAIKLSAGDNAEGSGLESVAVEIKNAAGEWWDGSAWSDTETPLAASYSVVYIGTSYVGIWAYTGAVPTGTNVLPDGDYQIKGIATDRSSNVATATVSISIDRVLPATLTFTDPPAGVGISDLNLIAGTTSDNNGGSGIARVVWSLKRSSDMKWWSGSKWGARKINLPTNYSAGDWSSTSGLPTRDELLGGYYTIVAQSYDKAGNILTASLEVRMLNAVDTIPPTTSFTAPGDGAASNFFPLHAIIGADDVFGSGLASIGLRIKRFDDQYWDGAAWGDAVVELPTTYSNVNKKWSYNGAVPTSGLLLDGNYQLTAVATDVAGNSRSSSIGIIIDKTIPATVTFTSPTANSSVGALDSVQGSATDNGGGSGIDRVVLTFKRKSNNQYWNGTAWVAGTVDLPTTFNAGGWVINSGLPSGADLPLDYYVLAARAVDKAGNSKTTPITVRVVPAADSIAPTVVMVAPVAGTAGTVLPTALMTGSDDAFGSGLASIGLQIKRFDNQYWNGSAWAGAAFNLPTTYSSTSKKWSYGGTLPTAVLLLEGQYQLIAVATDVAGNMSTAGVAVTIDKSVPTAPVFTRPTEGASITALPPVEGRALDNNGGSGVDRVVLTIRRQSTGLWWNGTAWVADAFSLPTTFAAGDWTVSDGLPGGADLPLDYYTLAARATDKAGNSTASSITVRVVAGSDTTAPTVAMVAPVAGTAGTVLPTALMTGSDDAFGSGLASIGLQIKRFDNQYWNGSVWVGAAFNLPTTYSSTSKKWSYGGTLPTAVLLLEGQYQLIAVATDNAGNTSTAGVAVTIDKTVPAGPTFSKPVAGASITELPLVEGSAVDNAGGSGVDRVVLTIKRQSTGLWWNGTAWVASSFNLPTTFGGGNWSINSGLPGGADLPLDYYVLAVRALDKAGNNTSASITVRVVAGNDSIKPTVAMTAPVSGSASNVFPVALMTGSDDAFGSGLASIGLQIRRFDNQYWNGSAWVGAAFNLPTTYSSTSKKWSYGGTLPSGGSMPNGAYQLIAVATDVAGNVNTAEVGITIDTIAPNGPIFTSPTSGAVITSLPAISGTADDNNNGSGVVRVGLSIKRKSDGLWWSGSGWGAAQTIITANLTGNAWTLNSNLPAGNALPFGEYTLVAKSYDKANNSFTSSIIVTVSSTAPA